MSNARMLTGYRIAKDKRGQSQLIWSSRFASVGKTYKPNGARECARRLKRIERYLQEFHSFIIAGQSNGNLFMVDDFGNSVRS